MRVWLRLIITVLPLFLLGGTITAAQEADTSLAARVSRLEEEADRAKRLKFSGYIQARYEAHQDSENSTVDSAGVVHKTNLDNIYIRRARLKAEYKGGKASRGVLYFDAGKDRIRLLEAFIELRRSFGRAEAALVAGQQLVPFGYEIEYSSTRRDFPERSTAEQRLFPGERDRLVNLVIKPASHVSFNAAILNGPGISNSTFGWESPFKNWKDFIARVKVSHQSGDTKLHAGASGYFGRQFDARDTVDFRTKKNRLGTDVQLFFVGAPRLGESGIRAEVYLAGEFDRDLLGWYVWLSQKLGKQFGAAIRYDTFDPDTDRRDGRKIDQVSLAAHYYHDENVRITCAYDIRKTEETAEVLDPEDNVLTIQIQFSL